MIQNSLSLKHIKFCIVGAGVSGIMCGHFFRLMGVHFDIIEKGSAPGGTWYWNRYPGIGCDVESHLYSLSFYRKSDWSKVFSLGDEIQEYMIAAWKFAKESRQFSIKYSSLIGLSHTYHWRLALARKIFKIQLWSGQSCLEERWRGLGSYFYR